MTQSGDFGTQYGYPGQANRQWDTPGRPWPVEYDPQAHLQRLGYPQLLSPGRPAPAYRPRGPHQYRPPQDYGYSRQPADTRPPQNVSRPQYSSQPQYSAQQRYGSPPPWRGDRHAVRNVLVGVGGLAVAVAGIVAAIGASHVTKTSSSALEQRAGGAGPGKVAGIGSVLTLSGSGGGEQIAVSVTKVTGKARPGDQFSSAPAGDRLYAVQFRLRDTGSAPYSDAPSNGAEVTDSAGQSYDAELADTAAGCTSFPGTENIAPGSSGLGCVVFDVPKTAKITQVQFTLDSGLGPDTGQWNVG